MVEGSTDSEWAFALFLDTLHSLGVDPSSSPGGGFGHAVLREAMLKTIARLNEFHAAAGTTEPSLLNFAATDGHSVICTRYVSSRSDEAASLFFSSGTRFHEYKEGGFYRMERHDRGQDLVMVASEPLTFERGDWVTVPTNSVLTINRQTVLIHPIIDQYYQPNPSYKRSTKFAEGKGMVGRGPEVLTPASIDSPTVIGSPTAVVENPKADEDSLLSSDPPSRSLPVLVGGIA